MDGRPLLPLSLPGVSPGNQPRAGDLARRPPCLQDQRSIKPTLQSQSGVGPVSIHMAHTAPRLLSWEGHGHLWLQRMRVPGPNRGNNPLSRPVLGRPGIPVPGHGSDRVAMPHGTVETASVPLQAETGKRQHQGAPSAGSPGVCLCPRLATPSLAGVRGPGLEEARAAHSSLCRGRHWGESLSSRTPSGAHTQGSWVSHCHLANWARSSSSAGA